MLILISGCSTRRYTDLYPYQPFMGPMKTPKAVIESKVHIETTDVRFYWLFGNYRVDSAEVISSIESYLECKERLNDRVTIKLTSLHNCKYPWGLKEATFLGDTYLEVLENGKVVYKLESPAIEWEGYRKIRTIVCLDPIIIVSVCGNIRYLDFVTVLLPGRIKNYCRPIDRNIKNGAFVVLQNGFAYGTRMPYDPNPTWFSPDLNVTPRPVEMLSETKGRIEVPWGFLILNKENDEWVVTTEGK